MTAGSLLLGGLGALAPLAATPAGAATFTCGDNWTGSAHTTDWATAGNWDHGVPTGSLNACVSNDSTVVVGNSTTASAQGLQIDSGSTVTVGAGSGGSSVAQLNVSSTLINNGLLQTVASGPGNGGMTLNGSLTNGGTITQAGPTTFGNASATTIANTGAWSLGTAATVTIGGSSTWTQSGTLTNSNPSTTSFQDTGAITIDGGSICGTGVDLTGGGNPTITFGSSVTAGPACGSGIASDQLALTGGTNTLAGNVASGYTLSASGNATIQTTGVETNNGTIVLGPGQLSAPVAAGTLTNAGTVDIPSGSSSTINAASLLSTGTLTVEGAVTIGNALASTITNEGTWTLGSSGTVLIGGSSSYVHNGLLTDNNPSTTSFHDTGAMTIDGGSICGYEPTFSGGGSPTLTFGTSGAPPVACGTGLSVSQIGFTGGTNTIAGNVPSGYTLNVSGNATLQTTGVETNNGTIVLGPGQLSAPVAAGTLTNAGTVDIPSGSSSTINAASLVSTGAVTVEGALTVGNALASALTSNGTWTDSSTGTVLLGGSSSLTQSGVLTNSNIGAAGFHDTGALVVDGGTICGTAVDLTGGGNPTLTFGPSVTPGPACGSGILSDQLALTGGTNTMAGNVPAGYTVNVSGNATLQSTAAETNNGTIVLATGQLSAPVAAGQLTNAGTVDIPSGSSSTINTANLLSTGAVTVEGALTVGNALASALTSNGTWTDSSTGTVLLGGSSSLTQSGVLTNSNIGAAGFHDTGALVVDGGTICGTAVDLTGGGNPTLTFGPSVTPGPACGSGILSDQLALTGGTNTMAGNVPAGYTVNVSGNATLQSTAAETNNGTIVLATGQLSAPVAAGTFTNNGTIGVTGTSTINASSLVSGPTGSVNVGAALTIGNALASSVTNNGDWTVSPSGSVLLGGSSGFAQNGLFTDNNLTANNFQDNGSLVVDGGTMCGTAPDITGGGNPTLTFGSSITAGPSCPAAQAENQIAATGGTNTMTGTIPSGYTLLVSGNATLQSTASQTNDGTIILAPGQLSDPHSGDTFTNSGTIDVPAGNSSTLNQVGLSNAGGSTLDVEGTLTIGNALATPATNDGTIGVAPGGLINIGGSSHLTNNAGGLLAFGISGLPSSTANYGRITNGNVALGGTADPVFDNGFTPPASTEYFVYSGSTYTGTFGHVLHNATADYSHPTEVGLTGGAPATQTTTSVVSSAPSGSVFGQPVTFTATVTPFSGSNPSGSVTFFDNGSILASAPVTTSAGVTTATLGTTGLRVGTNSITATYNGDVVFDASTSNPLAQAVAQDPSSVNVSPSPTSPIPGQPLTLTVTVSSTAPGAGTPTGDVSLTDNGTAIPGCQNLVMGPFGPSTVTCHITYTATASHTIAASYAGDTDFTSGSGSVGVTVVPAPTTTGVVSSANPGTLGVPVTYTATVTVNPPGTGTPTGTVSFTDNSAPITGCQNLALPASAPLSVQCVQGYTVVAGHSIGAAYSGDPNYATSNGGVSETLQQISTTTGVTGPSSAGYGQQVSFTASVTPGSSASVSPSGSVTFTDTSTSPATTLGTVAVSTTAGVTTAVFSSTTLPAGSRSIVATYNGDTTYQASAPSAAAPINVSQASSSLGLQSSANPSVFGQTVTFTATITPAAGVGPTGSVSFFDNGTPLGSGTVSGGQATFSTSALAIGTHPVTASYPGDNNFTASSTSSPTNQVVNQAATTTGVGSSANPGTVGQPVTYTATVTVNGPGTGTPTGTVSFTDNSAPILGCQHMLLPLTAPFSVQCVQTYANNASHVISAAYPGDSNFAGSSGGLTETMAQVGSSTSVALTSPVSGTSPYGSPVTFTATVTPGPGATSNPTGTVTFTDTSTSTPTTLGAGAVSTTAGVTTAVFTSTTLPAGAHTITATYNGDSQFSASTSPSAAEAAVTVTQIASSLAVQTSGSPSLSGHSVTFTATVLPNVGAGPTGTVTFFDNGVLLGTGPVSGGQAALTTSALGIGSHPITATYPGDGNFVGSATPGAITQVVNPSSTATNAALASSVNPSTVSQNITLTATVTLSGGGSGPPFTGTVTFLDGSTPLAQLPVTANGVVSMTTPQLASIYAIGTHHLTAEYSGDSNYGTSTSSPLNQVVAPPVFAADRWGAILDVINSATDHVANTFYDGATASAASGGPPPPPPLTASNYLAVSPDGTRVYLSQPFSAGSEMEEVNTATGAVVASTGLPDGTMDLAVSPDGTKVYTLQGYPANSVKVLNAATLATTSTITNVGNSTGFPQAMAMNPAGTELFVALQNSVDVVDLVHGTIAANIALAGADAVAVSPDGSTVYVANGIQVAGRGQNTVSFISTATNHITRTVLGMNFPYTMGVSPDGTKLFVGNLGTYSGGSVPPYIAVVNTASGAVTQFATTGSPVSVADDPAGTHLYVSAPSLCLCGGAVTAYNPVNDAVIGTVTPALAVPATVRPFGPTAPPPPPPPAPLAFSTTSLPGATQNLYYSSTVAATGGVAPYAFTMTGGSLPAGLHLGLNGSITGTPTGTGNSTFTVSVADSNFPSHTTSTTLSIPVVAGSTAPPPCGGVAPPPGSMFHNCVSGSSSTSGGTATATSTSAQGPVTGTAHGTGGITVGQSTSAPTVGVPFRASANGFDVAISTVNSFTSVTIVDCALGGATHLMWWNPATSSWQAATPESYNHVTRCVTLTLSASSSPTLAQLVGTTFIGVLPDETVSLTVGGKAPYSVSGAVVSGAVTITSGAITEVSGTVILVGSNDVPIVVTVNAACFFGLCAGTFSVTDPGAGVSVTWSALTFGPATTANSAGGQGVAAPGGVPFDWSVVVASA